MPRKIIEKYNVYKIDEHPDPDRVCNINRQYEVGDGCDWAKFTMDDWTEKLSDIGFEDAKISFSGFWSQGDGACFDATVNIDKLVTHLHFSGDNFNHYEAFKALRALAIADQNGKIEASIQSVGRYSHENSRTLSFALMYKDSKFNSEMTEVLYGIENLRTSLSRKIYADLEKEYNYQTSDEYLQELFRDHEIEFTENGDVYSE